MFPSMMRPAESGALRCEQRSRTATLCPLASRNVTIGKPFNKNGMGVDPTSLLAATVYQPGAKPALAVDSVCSSGWLLIVARAQFLRLPKRTFVSFA
jgi:hypothetical protein